jgi:vitamin B12 transporter
MRAVALDADRANATLTLDQFATPASGWGGGLMLRPPAGARTDLAFGADWRQAEGRSRERFNFQAGIPRGLREAGGRQAEGSLFADLRVRPADPLTLAASARLQHWRLSDGFLRETAPGTGALLADRPAPDRSGTDWAGAAGVGFRPPGARALRFHLEASRGIRVPTLNELHRPFRVGNDVTGANPALAPERLRMVEAALAFQPLASVFAELVLFDARLDSAIANVTIGQGPGSFPGIGFVPAGGEARQRRNIAAIASRGLEARGGIDTGAARPRRVAPGPGARRYRLGHAHAAPG